jgi:cytochrome P450
LKLLHDSGRQNDKETKRSIFHELLESDLPESEKTVRRLGAEAAVMTGAGEETTAWALSIVTFYLLTRPDIYTKVTDELKTIVTDPYNLPSWAKLEQLPYYISPLFPFKD